MYKNVLGKLLHNNTFSNMLAEITIHKGKKKVMLDGEKEERWEEREKEGREEGKKRGKGGGTQMYMDQH